MDQDLISKKDLLEAADITYGQLYRWKRKNLIPEEWFIRKSTYTGQETFFPQEQILSRIGKIQQMKGNISLDDLADMFSPNLTETLFLKSDLLQRNIVSTTVMDFVTEQIGDAETFSFEQVLVLYTLDGLLRKGKINLEEGKIVLQVLVDDYPSLKGRNGQLIFVRKFGMSTCFLCSSADDIYFEKDVRVVTRLNLAKIVEELKIKLM